MYATSQPSGSSSTTSTDSAGVLTAVVACHSQLTAVSTTFAHLRTREAATSHVSQMHLAEWLELSATIVGRVSSRRGGWAHRAATSRMAGAVVGGRGGSGWSREHAPRASILSVHIIRTFIWLERVCARFPAMLCLPPGTRVVRVSNGTCYPVLSRCVGRTSKMAFCEIRVIVICPI